MAAVGAGSSEQYTALRPDQVLPVIHGSLLDDGPQADICLCQREHRAAGLMVVARLTLMLKGRG